METDCLVGIQDMGAAGLTSSSVEMAARAGSGVELELDKVPTREIAMTPYELMLSESQERMLMVVHAGREEQALAVFRKWDLDAAVVGKVTDTERVVVKMNGKVYADMPAAPLAEGLAYDRPTARPAYLDEVHAFDPSTLRAPDDLGAAMLAVLGAPDVASKEWVWRQYDHNVRHGTVVRPGAADAGVVRVLAPDGREKGVAITTGCPNRMVWLDPYEGSRLAIAEAAANLVAVGATPLATTDCLNFGNPEKPEIMWQFVESVRGLGDACRALDTPIVSGNVSLYNETDGKAIQPTPMIGMVGLLADAKKRVTQCFRGTGDAIVLVGLPTGELGGSQYLKAVHGKIAGKPPRLDDARAKAVFAAMLAAADAQLLLSAHDISDGGLASALAESCFSGPERIGATVAVEAPGLSAPQVLFSEEPARFVVSCLAADEGPLLALCKQHGAPAQAIGQTGGTELAITAAGTRVALPLAALAHAWQSGFRKVAD
jgi:phosphoribosylformylglycinamidine synthase subunit PurL